ncbi:MAG: biotin/lipoyl-containing protein [Rhodothermales bacterium]
MAQRGTEKLRRYRGVVNGRCVELEIGSNELTILPPPDENSGSEKLAYSVAVMSEGHLSLIVDGRSIEAVVRRGSPGRYVVHIMGRDVEVDLKDEKMLLVERFGLAGTSREGIREVRAPMPGLVLSVGIAAGEHVSPGQGLVVLEAMKMENELRAESGGTVKAVHVAPGDAVGKNDLLLEILD